MAIKRKLFFVERFLYLDGDRSVDPVTITYMFSLKGNISYRKVRFVLDQMQERHPAFRARIEGNSICYEDPGVVPSIPLQIVNRLSDDAWKTEKESFIREPYDYEKGPLFRVLWIKSETVSDFVFSGLHVIIDWKSCVQLVKEFLALINDPDKAFKPYLPVRSMKELIPEVSLTWKEKFIANVWTEIFRWKLIFAAWNKKAPPPLIYSLFLNLDEEKSLAFKKMAEKKKVSLGGISCILAAKLFKAHFHPNNPECTIFISLDIRRYVTTVKRDMVFGFAPLIYPKIKVWDDKDIWEQASDFDQRMINRTLISQKTHSQSIFHSLTRGLVFSEYYNRIVGWMVKRDIRVNEGQDFIFLNLGKQYPLPKNPKFPVLKAYTPELRLPWFNPTIFGIGEFFDESIGFAFSSNEHHIPKEKMKEIRLEFEQAIIELIKEKPE